MQGHILWMLRGTASLRSGGARGRPVGPSRTGDRDPGGVRELWRVEGEGRGGSRHRGPHQGKDGHTEPAGWRTGEGPGRAAVWLGHPPEQLGEAEG